MSNVRAGIPGMSGKESGGGLGTHRVRNTQLMLISPSLTHPKLSDNQFYTQTTQILFLPKAGLRPLLWRNQLIREKIGDVLALSAGIHGTRFPNNRRDFSL